MSRLTNAILNGAYSRNSEQPMLDLSFGGQHGWSPVLKEWISNQAYVRRNLVCILLEAPKLFTLMPNSPKWVQALRSLVELHAKTIEGFNAGLTVEVDEHPVGGAGEMQQEVIDVKRARTEPVFTFTEKYNRPIQTFLDYWIRYGLMDPDTKYALASTMGNKAGVSEGGKDMLADWYSMTCLFIEPDPTHSKVIQSWLTTNMYPRSNGDIIGKRDLTSASELLELSVEFTGLSQYGIGVNTFAQEMLDQINIRNADPYFRKAFTTTQDSNVKATDESYEGGIEDLGGGSGDYGVVTNMTT